MAFFLCQRDVCKRKVNFLFLTRLWYRMWELGRKKSMVRSETNISRIYFNLIYLFIWAKYWTCIWGNYFSVLDLRAKKVPLPWLNQNLRYYIFGTSYCSLHRCHVVTLWLRYELYYIQYSTTPLPDNPASAARPSRRCCVPAPTLEEVLLITNSSDDVNLVNMSLGRGAWSGRTRGWGSRRSAGGDWGWSEL